MAWTQSFRPFVETKPPAISISQVPINSVSKIENQFSHPMNIGSQMPNSRININEIAGKKDAYKSNINGVMLPDYLKENLDIVVIGINPSLGSGNICHHYAGTGNHFWTCLYESRLVPVPVDFKDDATVLKYGIGFTNICTRSSKGTSDLSRKDVKEGSVAMLEKMRCYKPKIVVFNGKGIYETFVGHKNFSMGRQPEPLEGTSTVIFVMPSSSARCAQLPRAEDKLPFFVALRKLREHLRGERPHLEDSEIIFADYTEFRVTTPDPKSLRKAERRRKRKSEAAAAAATTVEQGNRISEEGILGSASPRKKKPSGALMPQQLGLSADNTAVKAISAANAFISVDQFQQPLHPPFLQTSAQAHQPQHIFAMQPATHFQANLPPQTHPQPHQMFVSANGQLMAATPMVSISVPQASAQQAPSAAPAQGAATAACYGSPFQSFLMSQSATGQPAGMVAWQSTAAWSAYQHAAAAAAAAAATATSGSSQQHPQQQSQQNQLSFSQHHHYQQQQQQQSTHQHFMFAGEQTVTPAAPPAPAYPQQLYLASAPAVPAASPASYHLLPVGCHPQTGFAGVFVPDQHQAAAAAAAAATAAAMHSTPYVTSSLPPAPSTTVETSFKVMPMGCGGSVVPNFLSALSSAPKTDLKVSALIPTSATTTSALPLVQTAAGGDETSVVPTAIPVLVQASATHDEKVVYSAL